MDAATTFYGDVAETARALRFYHLHFKYLLNSFHRKDSREILTSLRARSPVRTLLTLISDFGSADLPWHHAVNQTVA